LFCPGAIRGSFFILEFLLLVPFGKRNERVPVSSSYNYRGLMFAVSQVDYFRAKAIECEKLADKAADPEAERMLREAAEDWRMLVAQVEQRNLEGRLS
jgi:hypothetical protein